MTTTRTKQTAIDLDPNGYIRVETTSRALEDLAEAGLEALVDGKGDRDVALRHHVIDTSVELYREISYLVETLLRERRRLEADPFRWGNSLGIVQGRGADIDRLCAVLDTYRRMLPREKE